MEKKTQKKKRPVRENNILKKSDMLKKSRKKTLSHPASESASESHSPKRQTLKHNLWNTTNITLLVAFALFLIFSQIEIGLTKNKLGGSKTIRGFSSNTLAAGAMSFSSISVLLNALRLKGFKAPLYENHELSGSIAVQGRTAEN